VGVEVVPRLVAVEQGDLRTVDGPDDPDDAWTDTLGDAARLARHAAAAFRVRIPSFRFILGFGSTVADSAFDEAAAVASGPSDHVGFLCFLSVAISTASRSFRMPCERRRYRNAGAQARSASARAIPGGVCASGRRGGSSRKEETSPAAIPSGPSLIIFT
jgi:hypothetical protein